MSTYADTSFLVSLYVLDGNSASASAQMKQAKLPILLTAFGELELTNAIALRLFRKELLPSKVKAARALLAKDLVDGVLSVRLLPVVIFERAKQLALKAEAVSNIDWGTVVVGPAQEQARADAAGIAHSLSATCSFTSNRPQRRDQNLERHGVLALVRAIVTRLGLDV